jgi:hypothetical protein
MAKSKNHTNHNQNFKAHRNGIKRPRLGTKISTKGVSSQPPHPRSTPSPVRLSIVHTFYAAGGSECIRCGQKGVEAKKKTQRDGGPQGEGKPGLSMYCTDTKTHAHTSAHIIV